MIDATHPVARMLATDRRYKLPAYVFVFEALNYADSTLRLGRERATDESGEPDRHLTGQQLCEAIRLFALDQFGLMAKCVFNSWGVYTTSDFGEIVFNLIRIKQMKKTKEDRREDFNDVFDFDVFERDFKIAVPETK